MNDNFDLTTATSAAEQPPTVDAITVDTTEETPPPRPRCRKTIS